MQFWKRYSLFLALPRTSIPKSFCKGVVINFQLGDLQVKLIYLSMDLKKCELNNLPLVGFNKLVDSRL